MNDLIEQYTETLRDIRRMQREACEEDKSILGSMAGDLEYALEWMKTGRKPGNRRGVERLAAYQRERSYDSLTLQKFFRSTSDSYEWTEKGYEESVITEWDKTSIEDTLSVLTDRERDIYLMSRGQMLSYEQIAQMLDISKSSIQTTIERAEKKITEKISRSLFSFAG